MTNKLDKNFWLAVFSLVGTTIGAGIFSLPYAFAKSGFIIGFLELIFLVAVVLLIQLIIGEIALRTSGKKRFIAYAEKYLGNIWKPIVILSVLFSGFGVLLIYVLLAGRFLAPIFNIDAFTGSVVFFVIWFLAILSKPRLFGRAELFFSLLIFSIVAALLAFNFTNLDPNNFKGLNFTNFLLPYGVILFAISGFYVIPEMEDILGTEKPKLKRAIFYGTLIPPVLYLFFIITVLGISGSVTSPDAIFGFAQVLNSKIILIAGSLLGLLAVSQASLSYGVYIKETLCYDLKLNKLTAWLLTGAVPVVLFMLGIRDLIVVISIIGAVFFGFQAVMVLLIHKKSKTSEIKPAYEINLPNFAYYIVGLFAVLGAALEIWYNIF
ncbi:MAG: aromatic amino acid transport family protein [Candidatus Azambacteria bacterium]|nr:aromatic amino acid transport family protein [Candidatus Azambacteria bacterium]